MGILVILAFTIIILSVERFLFFKQYNTDAAIFLDGIRKLAEKNKFDEAIAICEQEGSPIAHLIQVIFVNRTSPNELLKAQVESTTISEIARCEQHISSLQTLAGIAPTLGLIGVVLCFYSAFRSLQEIGLTYTNSSMFSESITTAMLLLVVSLVINVFANMAYGIFYRKIQTITNQLEWTYHEVLQILLNIKK